MRRIITPLVISAACLSLAAGCDDESDIIDPIPVVMPDAGQQQPADAEPEDAEPVAPAPPLPEADAWCDAAAPAVRSADPAALQWSALHAVARLFGPHGGTGAVDDALAHAFDADEPTAAYAAELPFACAVESILPTALPPARVEVVDSIAYVYPGDGPLDIPGDVSGIVLDLTELTPHADLWSALARASAATLPRPLPRAGTVRSFVGVPRPFYERTSPFSTSTATIDLDPWPGEAPPRPVSIVVDPVQPPLVADLAASARRARVAALNGAAVFAATAESRALPIEGQGVAVRWIQRIDPVGDPWPDVIGADAGTPEQQIAAGLGALGTVVGPADRAGLVPLVSDASTSPAGWSAFRAALIVTHGQLRRLHGQVFLDFGFDSLFTELVDDLDQAPEDTDGAELLMRLLHVTGDSISGVSDPDDDQSIVLPVTLDYDGEGRPYVAASGVDDVPRGALIETIDGQDALEWLEQGRALFPWPNVGWSWHMATIRLSRDDLPHALGLALPDGSRTEVVVEPIGGYDTLAGTWFWPNAPLDAFDAPEVLYIDISGRQAIDEIAEALRAYPGVEALIVDARGGTAPGVDNAAAMLVGSEGLASPIFHQRTWLGPDRGGVDDFQVFAPGRWLGFAGPIVVLTSRMTWLRSEHLVMTLRPFGQVTFVGRPTSGVVGFQTGSWLPGDLRLVYNGSAMSHPDGVAHVGTGIRPDIFVQPTVAAVAGGRDEVLEAAIDYLQGR